MSIITLPNNSELDPLPYSEIVGLGADLYNYYIFRTEFGGYMIPKSELGDKSEEFRRFHREKVRQAICEQTQPFCASARMDAPP